MVRIMIAAGTNGAVIAALVAGPSIVWPEIVLETPWELGGSTTIALAQN